MLTHAWYSHKDIHKFLWVCPGRQLKSLIDYFLVRKDIKARVHDVKVVRGAELGSDHHLILMKWIMMNKGETRDRVDRGAKICMNREAKR